MTLVAVDLRLAVLAVAGRAGDPFAVVVRLVGIGLLELRRLFGEVLVGAVAGEARLVVGHDEGVAGDGVFLGVADGAVPHSHRRGGNSARHRKPPQKAHQLFLKRRIVFMKRLRPFNENDSTFF